MYYYLVLRPKVDVKKQKNKANLLFTVIVSDCAHFFSALVIFPRVIKILGVLNEVRCTVSESPYCNNEHLIIALTFSFCLMSLTKPCLMSLTKPKLHNHVFYYQLGLDLFLLLFIYIYL